MPTSPLTPLPTGKPIYARYFGVSGNVRKAFVVVGVIMALVSLWTGNYGTAIEAMLIVMLLSQIEKKFEIPWLVLAEDGAWIRPNFMDYSFTLIPKALLAQATIKSTRITMVLPNGKKINVGKRSVKKEQWDELVGWILKQDQPNQPTVMASGWKKCSLPYIAERYELISLPLDGQVLTSSGDDGFVMLDLHTGAVKEVPDTNEEVKKLAGEHRTEKHLPIEFTIDGKMFEMCGLYGGAPLLNSPQGEELRCVHVSEKVWKMLLHHQGSTSELHVLNDVSGDWTFASFSRDGKYILIGNPYDLIVYERNT